MGGGGGAKDLAKEANFIGVADFDLDLVIVVFEMASLKEALRVLGVDIGNVFLAGVVVPLGGVSGFFWISDLVIVVFELASLNEALRVLGVDIGKVFLAGVVSPLDEVSWSSSPACGAFAGDNLGLLSTLS